MWQKEGSLFHCGSDKSMRSACKSPFWLHMPSSMLATIQLLEVLGA